MYSALHQNVLLNFFMLILLQLDGIDKKLKESTGMTSN